MHLVRYHTIRLAVKSNGLPAPRSDLDTLAGSLSYLLGSSDLFDHVEVEVTDDEDRLVIGLCQIKPEVSDFEAALVLEQIWQDRVRYPYWEAHAILVESGHVELEGATKHDSSRPFVTVHVVAAKQLIPEQRAPKPDQRHTDEADQDVAIVEQLVDQTTEDSRSIAPSFGGSTKR